MGKIKIGLIILGSIAVIGLVVAGIVMAKNGSNNGEADYAPGQIIVKFKGDVEPFRIIRVPEGKVADKIKEYQDKVNVIYAEPNYFVYALGSNDKAYINQWALNNTGQTIHKGSGSSTDPVDTNKPIGSGTSGADVDWEEAWTAFGTTTFATTVIAIVDSGVDWEHPDLSEKIIPGIDYVDGGKPVDVYGHGTHVAGIAAAVTNNSIGIAGIAFSDNIKIMPVRVLDENGMSTAGSVAKGIIYAADNGAKVINLSLGTKHPSTALKEAVNYAWSKGVVLAAAAGNDGGGAKYYPASFPNVISVAATDYNDKIAYFSNFNSEIDVSAPGVNVFSTFPTYPFTIQSIYGRSQNYDVGSGTSMSVPHVVGLAGLLFAQGDNRTNVQVRDIIEKTADDLGATGWDKHFGWGRINVNAALNYSGGTTPPECIPNGALCNCNGKCNPKESPETCPWDCP
ncbi:S8 family peptidase [Patescibacteria group bacterium]|nr:S8 family peptidase [Patescibacteria group bacterium]